MECNKDEALRAQKIAEEKLAKNEFERARSFALKAKKLFPELANISQLITVCDIHIAAQKKVGNAEKDLYGILQIENVADETTIRKQFRKLALLLHPDKNKYLGAEAAFKLIGEANMILSDKGKRSIYDIKYGKTSAPKIQNRQGNQTSHAGEQNKSTGVPGSQFSGVYFEQKSASNLGMLKTFWTHCPFCNVKYEYYRDFVNKPLRCQHCLKMYIAYDNGASSGEPNSVNGKAQKVNLGSKSASQQKKAREAEKAKGNTQKDGSFSSNSAHKKTEDPRKKGEGVSKPKVCSVQKPPETGTAKGRKRKRESKLAAECKETDSNEKEAAGGGVSGNDAQKPMETGTAKATDKKRVRKKAAESGDKKEAAGGGVIGGNTVQKPMESGTAKAMDKDRGRKNEADSSDKKEEAGGGNRQRISSRQRQQVSYREDGGGEFSPQKHSEMNNNKSSNDVEDIKMEDVSISPNGKEKVKEEEEECGNDSDSEPELVACPEQEFTNFDRNKEEHCFAVGQIWACYDSNDAMPRFYAQIKKIYPSKFKMRITWFESKPDNEAEIKWVEEELPVACGRFEFGDSMVTSDRLMFSHQIVVKKDAASAYYFIGPQKGEIWAVYKDWDIKWSLDPENHRKDYKFDIVEIVQVHDDYISVAHLLKVKGFISVFQRGEVGEHKKIPCNERFRFSHAIPSAKLTGSEREGVPAGSFELDMASLPPDFEKYCLHHSKSVNTPRKEKVKPATNLATTPKKKNMDRADKDLLTPRRSPRGLKTPKQQN